MIVTYNWLKEFVDFDLSSDALADLLTMIGLEVEGLQKVGTDLDEVVVAIVREKAQHPNADKLSLCQVDNGKEVLTIVCGAQNFKTGDTVALAQIGAVLPGDFRIKRSKIRGSESFGMLCSEKELGLADESEGIMILPSGLPLGTPVFEALGLKDVIFEIGLTPNRADCLSVIGIAREIAAMLGLKVKYPSHDVVEKGPAIDTVARISVQDADLCPRYMARYLTGCTVGPSPSWMVNRLNAVGIRSINNVVDITNYVLLEYGHPLHAFDYRLLAGGAVIVERAADGEKFVTLDEQERALVNQDLTIRDAEKAIALAGIMGGENSEISDSTTDILLESAYFEPSAIRRTARRLGMHTEASHRFERGADISILPRALDRAATLMAELAGGKLAVGSIDVYPTPVQPRTISVRLERIACILGIELPLDEVIRIFHNLEFTVLCPEPGILHVTVPTYRVDIEREIDLIEEVARLNGYENIPVTMPKIRAFSDLPSPHQVLERKLRDLLVAHGLSEVITYSFVNTSVFNKIMLDENDPRRNPVKVLNPLSEDQAVMRTTLLPGLLDVTARNLSVRLMNVQVFELRRIYLPVADSELPVEPVYAAGILTGSRDPECWNRTTEPVDFYDVKGMLENVFESLGISGVLFEARELETYYHPGKACSVYSGQDHIGSFGEIHPTVQENFGIEKPLYYFELNFEKLLSLCTEVTSVSPPPRYPDTFRDIALLVQDEMETGIILDCIRGNKMKEMENVELFDLYKGPGIPEGHKSIAVRVRYRSPERTLTDEEVNRLQEQVVQNVLKKINVTIR
ncbi:MAG: phenylalanine--tRNA ligase subunit beta [Deltaproteobacteria bacterium]|nr:phenylalanine--tRNA ligase subunit beta [Deltaproteobacteria bacterium]TLN04504.1 MAG: phenylalanine--tRNA ligase subunit beta [bacterium]